MSNDTNNQDEARADKLFSILRWALAVIFLLLVTFVSVGGWWMWQISHTPVVNTMLPTNFPRHPNAISPFQVLTSQALSAIPPQTTNTPSLMTPTPTVVNGQLQIFSVAAPVNEPVPEMAIFAKN